MNNRVTYYEYDGLGKPKLVRDENRNVVKTYQYNYRTTFYSKDASVYIARNNCPVGYSGTSVTYPVPAGKYTSLISQADADVQAANDALANAQAYANNPVNGSTCYASSIYSVLSYENVSPDGMYGDVVVRFYADANLTIPATVYDYNLTYNRQEWCSSGSNYTYTNTININNQSVVYLESQALLYYSSSYWDPNCWCWQMGDCWIYYYL